MIRNLFKLILLAGVALAIWRIWGSGGSVSDFFNTVYGFAYSVIDAIAKFLVLAWDTLVVHKSATSG